MTIIGDLDGTGTLHVNGIEMPVRYALVIRQDGPRKSASGRIRSDGAPIPLWADAFRPRIDLGGGRFITVTLVPYDGYEADVIVSGPVPGF